MKLKFILCLLLVLAGGLFGCSTLGKHASAFNNRVPLGSDATTQKLPTVGNWSAPVNGLRGRLLFAEDETFDGTRLGAVYLELQKVSDVINPIEIGTVRSLRCSVVDASNKLLPQSDEAYDIWMPISFTITLPDDSILRFRVSVDGYALPKNAGLLIGLSSGCWIIPPNARRDYFLSAGTNSISIDTWHGVLQLPKVKILAKVH